MKVVLRRAVTQSGPCQIFMSPDDFFVERIAEASWMFESLINESGDRVKTTCPLK